MLRNSLATLYNAILRTSVLRQPCSEPCCYASHHNTSQHPPKGHPSFQPTPSSIWYSFTRKKSADSIIHMMLRDWTSFPHHRPQQSRPIHFRPYTPVVAGFVVRIEGREGGEHVWEVVGGLFFVCEQAGEVEDVGAGEGDEEGFVWVVLVDGGWRGLKGF